MISSYFLPSYECALSLLDKPYGLLNLPDHFGSLFKAEVQFQNSNVGWNSFIDLKSEETRTIGILFLFDFPEILIA